MDSPLAMQLSPFVQICVLSFGVNTLFRASRQSDKRAPPTGDWPQLIPVPEGKTAVAVVEVDEVVGLASVLE